MGYGGAMLHWNGMSWSDVNSGTANDLSAVWGTATDDVWATGNWGVAWHWDGGSWTQTLTGTDAPLNGVWVDSHGTARAVGQGGAILRH